ncbi:MAG: septum formation initiator family protein [Clostridia bacterium]|nr:septum formation initiator family protein [Clostridia bacterium]
MSYKQRKKIEKIVAMCLLSFAVVVIIAVYSFVKLGAVRRENANYNEYIAALELKQDKLSKDVDNMKTDEYLEEQARDNLDMIKDGETLYIYK